MQIFETSCISSRNKKRKKKIAQLMLDKVTIT